MNRFFAAITILLSLVSVRSAQPDEINIIPKPVNVVRKERNFEINKNTRIVLEHSADKDLARFLSRRLKADYGLDLKISSKASGNPAIFISRPDDYVIFNEGYSFDAADRLLHIEATTGSGRFYGVQTLLQLIRKDGDKVFVPNVSITDHARFSYRGMHLDIARHFQPVEFVKKFIDQMAQYKFNYFHWHLTDDQAWRIEIKKYPKLTEIGSTRPETVRERNLTPYIGDGVPHGGFYTQEQIKEVVKYAKERYITVIPEIELPGHASAALAAYPQFGCKADYKYKVQTTWGIFKEVYCPTEETFKFLEDVLDETISLFPDSPYIHIGGDEVLKDHWKESAFVQQLKAKENLKDEHEVQSYFVRRSEKYINSKGKKMIGWDEILEGGLAPNATVMSWRGMKGGIEAAKSKHDVIMTPTDYVYFDYGQGDPAYEPLNIGSYVPLEKVYSFEPVPPELTPEEAKYIIGGQANIWTEYMKTPVHVEYMAFPRMLALAEVVWSKKEDRNFTDFQRRLSALLPRLDKQNVNYRIPEPGGLRNIVTELDKVSIELQPSPGTRLHHTTDGTTPDERSAVYEKPITLTLKPYEPATLKTIVINQAGRKSSVYASTIIRREWFGPTAFVAEPKQGVNFSFTAEDVQPETGETKSITLQQFVKKYDLKKPFTVVFDGYIKVEKDEIYEFQTDSVSGASIEVDYEKPMIDVTKTKERIVRSAVLPLRAGYHRVTIRYDHAGGEPALRFRYGIKGQGLRQAYGGEFVH